MVQVITVVLQTSAQEWFSPTIQKVVFLKLQHPIVTEVTKIHFNEFRIRPLINMDIATFKLIFEQ